MLSKTNASIHAGNRENWYVAQKSEEQPKILKLHSSMVCEIMHVIASLNSRVYYQM